MFLVYFALWVFLNGKWTTEIAVFGVVISAVLYAFTCRFLGNSTRKERRLIGGFLAILRYGAMLIREIVLANLSVMRIILSPEVEPQPQLVRFHTGLKDELHRVVLADSITLTPGTITTRLLDDEIAVHCLDKAMMDELLTSPFMKALHEMEEKA